MVSIRCLDEGVDIPAVSHALILASSKNPREYVQRRGRVLRKSPGKSLSHIHDVLVTPLFDPDEPPATAILEGELARAIEFGAHALNPGAITDLERLAIEHGIDWTQLTACRRRRRRRRTRIPNDPLQMTKRHDAQFQSLLDTVERLRKEHFPHLDPTLVRELLTLHADAAAGDDGARARR